MTLIVSNNLKVHRYIIILVTPFACRNFKSVSACMALQLIAAARTT